MATRSWNRVELMGNLTRDPELRYTPSGAAVCTFSIATNRSYVVDGERKEEADFHRCVAWNKLAELCNQLLKKGVRVFVSGRLQNRSWEDASGQQKQTTEIVIEDMILLTSKSVGSTEEAPVVEELPSRDINQEKVSQKEDSKEKKVESDGKEVKDEADKDSEPEPVNESVNDSDLPF